MLRWAMDDGVCMVHEKEGEPKREHISKPAVLLRVFGGLVELGNESLQFGNDTIVMLEPLFDDQVEGVCRTSNTRKLDVKRRHVSH
ncbi:hypothetical protein PsorP6_006010 [Peronosclerospora sorghi]|uniref:Uncharacterized protein n=1 Tax=Peronosclerospora sorghi TaxID=230839 RepID=A0ACC0W439_9STRA|nr:hypothetical protein PsorP6_006010 [Peronosclerospora sorghi]